jgi:hypothetical protein
MNADGGKPGPSIGQATFGFADGFFQSKTFLSGSWAVCRAGLVVFFKASWAGGCWPGIWNARNEARFVVKPGFFCGAYDVFVFHIAAVHNTSLLATG